MVKSIRLYDENGVLVLTEELGANGVNVSISVTGLNATNLQSALAEIVAAIADINNGSNYSSGVTVDGVGSLSAAFGNIQSGTDINGLTLTELLVAAFGNTSSV